MNLVFHASAFFMQDIHIKCFFPLSVFDYYTSFVSSVLKFPNKFEAIYSFICLSLLLLCY